MNEKTAISDNESRPNDQTDLFEIIGFFWRGKFYVIGTTLIGIASAFYFFNLNPQRDAATYLVPIDIRNSTLENGPEAIQRFNENIGKYAFDTVELDSKAFPNFSKSVFNVSVSVENGNVQLHFSNTLVDTSGESQIQFAKALAAKIAIENQKHEQLSSVVATTILKQLTEQQTAKLQDSEKNFMVFSKERGLQMANLRIDIYKFMMENFPREVGDCSTCDIETFLNKALIANHYKKNSIETKKKLHDQIIQFFTLNAMIGAKYHSLIQGATDTIRQAMLDKFVSIDLRKGLSLSPTYSVNFTSFSKSKTLNQHIRHRTTKPLFLGVGAILGFALGTLIYGSAVFIRNNKAKLLAALK
ncbi:MAG: hypothetical protein NT027_02380 [Proteobacteria bacterium]|nr:hypothetical protein [Pseudomonadota bacterium]